MADNRQKPLEISQAAFFQARNNRNLSIEDLAQMACLSTHQIKQIEGGGQSAFYSPEIKITAAKKVALLLGMKEEDAFISDDLENPLETGAKIDSGGAELEKISVDAMLLSRQPKQSSLKKKIFLWLILVVLATFLIVALRTVFFQQSIEQIVIIKEKDTMPIESATTNNAPSVDQTSALASSSTTSPAQDAPAPEPALIPAIKVNACPVADEQIPIYKTASPRKIGNVVYVQAKKGQVVCIEDATGKSQQKTLDAGIGASFFGRPPFKLMTADLSQVEIFFQGKRVYPENPQGRTLMLESMDVVMPVNNTDSGLR